MKKNHLLFRLILTAAIGATSASAADNISLISGNVWSDKNEPLAYANVFIKESFEGTTTDEKGYYQFTSSFIGKATLVCTFIGYKTFYKNLALPADAAVHIDAIMVPEPIGTPPVLVTASAFTAADSEGVTLTAMDVVRTPGAAADLFWAIKTLPGLQQVEEGAGLFVRGGDVTETAILLDGAYIQHPYKYESPTGGYFGTFNPFLLKGTFFASGGFSVLYGNALSGALAMESLDLPDRKRIGVGIGLAAESAYLSLPLVADKLGLSFSGNRSNTRMLFELNQAKKIFSHYPASYDLNLNSFYRLNPNSYMKFFVYQAQDKIGIEVDDPDYKASHFYGSSDQHFFNLKYHSLIANKFLLQVNAAFSDFNRDMSLAVMDLRVLDRMYQTRWLGEADIHPDYKLRAGLEFFRFHTRIAGQVPQDELDLNPAAPVHWVDTDYRSNRVTQFIEMEAITPIGLRMIPGLRSEYESLSGVFSIDPRLALSYPVATHATITAAWGRYQQSPEPSYYDPYVGNPSLTAMSSTHYILGYIYQKENAIFRLEGYYKDYQDLLLADSLVNYTNNGRGFAMGLDAFVKRSWGPISGWIAYSWLKARRKWQDQPVMASPYFDITHNLTLVLNLDLPKRIALGSSYRLATGKPYTPAPGRYNQARVPDYQKLDLSLSYLHSFFADNYTIFYLSVSNLMDRMNIFDYRYSRDYQRRDPVESAMGRTYYFGMTFNM